MKDLKATKLKIQHLLIRYLLSEGQLDLVLPDGVKLEIGILQEDLSGKLVKAKDYCYVVASRDCKKVLIDSYNLGLQFEDEDNTIICEDESYDDFGRVIRSFDVV